MTLYKLAFLCLVFFIACKNETTVNTTTPVTDITTPAKEIITSKAENISPSEQKTEKTSIKIDTVSVSTLEELVDNAKSNTVIYLEKGSYNLKEDLVYYMTKDERTIIDKKVVETRSIGGQLFFSGLNNFQIIGKKGAKIISENPQAVVFFVILGKNLKFSNLNIKKEIVGQADLIYVSTSQDVEIESCLFDGGGTYGMNLNNVDNIKINNCKISNCTSGILKINNSRNVNFINSDFSNNIGTVPAVNLYGEGSFVTFNNVTFSNNNRNLKTNFEGSDILFAVGKNSIQLENCVIQNNKGYKYLGVNPNFIKNSQIDGLAIE